MFSTIVISTTRPSRWSPRCIIFSTSFFAHFLDTTSQLGLRATSAVLHFSHCWYRWIHFSELVMMLEIISSSHLIQFQHCVQTPLVTSVCAPLRPLSVFYTFYITGFIFPSSWWCLRSFLALTCHNLNSTSLHLAASICAPHRPSSDYFTLLHEPSTPVIHQMFHSFASIHSPRKEAHQCSPPTLSLGHHKCSLIEHFLLAWPLIQSLLICFQTP